MFISKQQIHFLVVACLNLVAVPKHFTKGFVAWLLELLWLFPRAVSIFALEVKCLAGTFTTPIGEHNRVKPIT